MTQSNLYRIILIVVLVGSIFVAEKCRKGNDKPIDKIQRKETALLDTATAQLKQFRKSDSLLAQKEQATKRVISVLKVASVKDKADFDRAKFKLDSNVKAKGDTGITKTVNAFEQSAASVIANLKAQDSTQEQATKTADSRATQADTMIVKDSTTIKALVANFDAEKAKQKKRSKLRKIGNNILIGTAVVVGAVVTYVVVSVFGVAK